MHREKNCKERIWASKEIVVNGERNDKCLNPIDVLETAVKSIDCRDAVAGTKLFFKLLLWLREVLKCLQHRHGNQWVLLMVARCRPIDRFLRKQDKILSVELVRRSTSKLIHDKRRLPPAIQMLRHTHAYTLNFAPHSQASRVSSRRCSGGYWGTHDLCQSVV